MISTFHGLEMGKRSLASHQQAINTTGHNLNNMNTEGYSRQTVKLSTFEPLYVPGLARSETAGQIGQGTTVTSIDRVRDQFIDNRIISAGKDLGFFDMRNKYLQQMEMVYAEPSVYNDPSQYNTLRRAFDEFMSSWSDVANNPDDKAPRNVLVEKANILTNRVRHHFNQMTDIRNNVDIEIKNKVGELNEIASKIAKLNERILKSEAVGDHPNDLYDSRDVFIDKLSKMADIQISREDPDELILYIGGKMIVQGAESEKLNLTAQADNYGYSDVYWADGEKVAFRGGELGSLVDVRDTDLRMEQKKINSFAVNISDLVNEIHRDGFGLNETTGNDFFSTHPFTTDPTGNFDANRDGADDSTFIFKVTGANTLDGNDKLGIRGTMNVNNVEIDYYETDTLDRVVRRINESGAGVNAFLNPQGKLTVKADYYGDNQSPDFVIRRLEDNGLFLTGYAGILNQSGAEGGFNSNVVNETGTKLNAQSVWSIAPLTDPAQYMAIEKKIENDVSFIAVASGIDSDGDGIKDISNGIGDSQNALRISSLKDNKVMVGMSLSVSQYFENIVSDVGARGQKAENGFRVQETIMNNLENLRKSVSGVNLDEEFANLIKFQHGYNASAKFISEMDKMLETIITKL